MRSICAAAVLVLTALVAAGCEPPPSPDADPVTAPPAPERVVAEDRAERDEKTDLFPVVLARDDEVQQKKWFSAAYLLADRTRLPAYFDEIDYRPPGGSLVLYTQVKPGVDQPRYHYFTLGDSGFAKAPRAFVPASTVKLMASMAALWTLSEYGLNGDSRLSFNDTYGRFEGTAHDLYKEAILHSSNQNYNRLMLIAGFDETNTKYLNATRGTPIMRIQSPYGKERRGITFRRSPEIEYEHDDIVGTIPKRRHRYRNAQCRGNCTTLFELQDIMRRVMLNDEIPLDWRFPVARRDLERVQALLLRARNRLQPSPDRAYGTDVDVYNSVGRIPGIVLLENGFLEATETGERALLAVSMRFRNRERDPKPELQAMALHTLDAGIDYTPRGPGLQHDAGPPVELEWRVNGEGARGLMRARSDGVDSLRFWIGRKLIGEADRLEVGGPAEFVLEFDMPDPGPVLVIAEGFSRGRPVSYHSWIYGVPG